MAKGRKAAIAAAWLALGLSGRSANALVGGPSSGAVSAQTLKTPDKPASVKGLSDAASAEVFSAQVKYQVPLDLPQGRNGFGPQLGLVYSGELGNGPLGLGWHLGDIAIRRSVRQGVPSYSDSDELEMTGIGGGGRLVANGTGKYLVEGHGNSIQVEKPGDYFRITDAAGTTYLLGTVQTSREGSTGKTSAWYVDLVQDVSPAKQQIQYTRSVDGGRVYLKEIAWGPGSAPRFKMTIGYESRSDKTVSWATGQEIDSGWRIQKIEVFVTGQTAALRSYALTYEDELPVVTPSDDLGLNLSRLASIKVAGFAGTSLPELTFGYVTRGPGSVTTLNDTEDWKLNDRGTSFFDVDGDGLADLLRMEMGNHVWKKNLGGKFAAQRLLPGAESIELGQARLMDLDGDARPELVYIVNDTWRVYKLAGQGNDFHWESKGEWPGTTTVPLHAPDTVFADINGDGRTDVLKASVGNLRIRLGGPNGLGSEIAVPQIDPTSADVEPGQDRVRFVDWNGDGLVDVVYLTDEWMKIWLGRGDGTFAPFARPNYPWGSGAFPSTDVVIADLDRDGIADIVHFTAGNVEWYPGLPDGTISSECRQFTRPVEATADSVVTVSDVNGNGSQELVWSAPAGIFAIDFAGSGTAGMLSGIDNGMGKQTLFAYEPSALLSVVDEQGGNTWTSKLPVSIPVPVEQTVVFEDGTVSRTLLFRVRDGFWDGGERRFGGFLTGIRITPGSAPAVSDQVLFEETDYHAGLGDERVLRGVATRVEQRNGSGLIYSRARTDWSALPTTLPTLARRAVKNWESTESLEGVTTPIETLTTYGYDDEGRPNLEQHSGRLDIAEGDEFEVRRAYASSPKFGVRDKVCLEEMYDGNGQTLISRRRYFYGDNQAVADSESGEQCGVGRGWLRRTEGHLESGNADIPLSWQEPVNDNLVLASREYDQYGNVTSSYEAGVTRTLSYDSLAFHPLSESVSPSSGKTLTWAMTWDAVQDLPASATDPNQVTTNLHYDDLGRETKAWIGTDPAKAHILYSYDWRAPRPTTTTYAYDGDLATNPGADPTGDGWADATNWRQTTLVADGGGEDLFSATRLGASQWIVTDWKERDGRGKVAKHGDAFYWTGTDPTAATPPTVAATDPNYFRFQTLKYDALGRLKEQDLPNGASKTVTYKAFEQTVSASELAPVRSILDGLGRVRRTERTVSGIVESVDAAYDAAGRIQTMTLQGGKAVHEYRYDTLGRMIWAKDPDIGTRELRYSDEGFLIRHMNGAGDVLAFVYDHAGRLSGRGTFAPGQTSSDAFVDPAADAFTAPAWNSNYSYTYDDQASEVTACSAAHTAGRLAAVDEPAGTASGTGRVAFCYDELGRQNAMTRSINGGAARAWILNKQGASGLLLYQEADDGFKLYPSYDRSGRLQSLDDNPTAAGDIWHPGTTATPDSLTGLDAAGRVFSETYGNGLVQSYQRDQLGLPSDIQIAKPPASPIYHVTLPSDGGRTLYGAPRKLIDDVPGGLDHSATYDYDGAARLTNATMGEDAATQWSFRFQYDGLQNMTGRTQKGPNPAGIGILAGAYRYGETINGKAHGPRQLTSVSSEDCTGNGQSSTAQATQALATYDYDGAGRMVSGDKRTLSYDGYDQLLRVDEVGKSPLVQYAYGFDGVRTFAKAGSQNPQYWFTESYTTAPDGSRWHYVSVGDRLVARLSFSAQTAPIKDPLGIGIASRILGWGGRHAPSLYALIATLACLGLLGLAFGRRQRAPWIAVSASTAIYALLLAMGSCDPVEKKIAFLEVSQDRLYYHQGVAAGPVMTTKSSGAVDEERRYEPFGQVIDAWGANMSIPASFAHQPFNSLNKETDAQTKWSYHGARWMMPQTARWTAPDPAVKGPDGKFMIEPWATNPYSYVRQSPTIYWDSTGYDEDDARQESVGTSPTSTSSGINFNTQQSQEPQVEKDWSESPKGQYDVYIIGIRASRSASKEGPAIHPGERENLNVAKAKAEQTFGASRVFFDLNNSGKALDQAAKDPGAKYVYVGAHSGEYSIGLLDAKDIGTIGPASDKRSSLGIRRPPNLEPIYDLTMSACFVGMETKWKKEMNARVFRATDGLVDPNISFKFSRDFVRALPGSSSFDLDWHTWRWNPPWEQ